MECLLEAMDAIFRHIEGVPPEIWFDNTSTIVTKIIKGGTRNITERFTHFQEHYGFKTVFCNPESGWEKGIDALYLSINLKGTKKDMMSRKSKKRGQGSSYRGLSHHKICIISAIDENDNMMMKITGLGAESAEKYLECATRFKETEVIVSDSKSCIRQLANVIGAINENIPVYGGQKRYKTPAGRSLGSVNEMMTDISMIISRTRGFGTRYLDDYMSFNLFRKKLRYTVKRKDMRDYVYEKLIHSSQITLSDILKTVMPISLKEAYYEYGFGIFNEKKQHLS